jgi:hypothetical protein
MIGQMVNINTMDSGTSPAMNGAIYGSGDGYDRNESPSSGK